MSLFEIIIISFIYLFCYGYALAMFIKEENILLRILFVFVSFVIALYVPLFIGGKVYEKLNNEIL
jgi:hypothetical protein